MDNMQVFEHLSPSGLQLPKLHDLMHIIEDIRERGHPDNATAEAEEQKHKETKGYYRRSNKQRFGQTVWKSPLSFAFVHCRLDFFSCMPALFL
jgi:hypothetical protein